MTMKVLVCIKSVPAVAGRITLTGDARAIDTRHLGFAIGPHEECAVEQAVRHRVAEIRAWFDQEHILNVSGDCWSEQFVKLRAHLIVKS